MYRYLLSLAMVLICNTAIYAVDLVGNVTDADDKPLAGVRIDILTVVPKSIPPKTHLFDTSFELYRSSRHPICKKFAMTDKAGKFIIHDIDPDLNFNLAASVAGKQVHKTALISPTEGPITIEMQDLPKSDTGHLLKGVVVDRDGTPIPNAFVESEGFQDGDESFPGRAERGYAVTDKAGAFEIAINSDPKMVNIEVSADSYPETIITNANLAELSHRIELPTGTRLTGQLAVNGKPAANQKVAVVQVNQTVETATGIVDFSRNFSTAPPNPELQTKSKFISAVLATTDDKGRFIFENLPHDQCYAIYTPYQATDSEWVIRTAFFKAKGDNQTFDLGTLPLVRSVTIAGKVTMEEGEALPSGNLLLKHSPAFNSIKVPLNSKGEFRVENLSPETYQISIYCFNSVIDETKMSQHIINDQEFAIHVSKDRNDVVIPLRKLREEEMVDPEEMRTSPDLQLSLEASKEDSFEQALTGIVVDPNEKPLGGVSLSAIPLNFGKFMPRFLLPKGSEINTRSCPEGSFVLDALSDQLMVLEVKSPAAERARFGDSKLPMFPHAVGERRVEKNQKDIRIIFDPEVFTKIPEIK